AHAGHRTPRVDPVLGEQVRPRLPVAAVVVVRVRALQAEKLQLVLGSLEPLLQILEIRHRSSLPVRRRPCAQIRPGAPGRRRASAETLTASLLQCRELVRYLISVS